MNDEQHFFSISSIRTAMLLASPKQHITDEAIKFIRDDLEEKAISQFTILANLLHRINKKTITVSDIRTINQLKKLI